MSGTHARILTLISSAVVIALCIVSALAIHAKPNLPADIMSVGGRRVVRSSPAAEDTGSRDAARAGETPGRRTAQAETRLHAVLLPDDTLDAINGIAVSDPLHIEFLLDRLRIGDEVTVRVHRGSSTLSIRCRLARYYNGWYLATTLGIALIYLTLGILVALRRPLDGTARLFHLLSSCAALSIGLTWGSLVEPSVGVALLLRSIFALAVSFIGVLLLHFMSTFPGPMIRGTRALLTAGYVSAAMLAVAQIATLVDVIHAGTGRSLEAHAAAYQCSFILLALCTIASIVTLARTYRNAREEAARRIVRLELGGVTIALLGFLLLWWFPVNMLGLTVVSEAVAVTTLLAAPAAFAAAVLRYRALDVDVFIRRGTMYLATLVVLLASFAAAAVLVGIALMPMISDRFALSHDQARIVIAVLVGASLIVALLVEPARQAVQRFIDRRIYQVRYDHRRELLLFRDQLRDCFTEDQLAAIIVRQIDGLFGLDRLFVFTIKPGDGIRDPLADTRPGQDMHDLAARTQVLIETGAAPILARPELVESGVAFTVMDADFASRTGAAMLFTLRVEERPPVGAILVGAKRSGLRFAAEDVELLAAIAAQAALSIERMRLQSAIAIEHEEAVRLAELNRMKTYFVSAVTHDLKTPLTVMHMFTELLEQRTEDATSHEWLRIIRGESARLTAFIDNILGYSQIEQGARIYAHDPVDLNDVAREALEAMHYQFTMHKADVTVHLDPAPCPVLGDARALQQAVLNLLTNALRYSPDPKTIVVASTSDAHAARLSVTDHGVGIAASDLERIFLPFTRTHTPHEGPAHEGPAHEGPAHEGPAHEGPAHEGPAQKATRTGGSGRGAYALSGTGLGLTIVRHVIDMHEGRVEVDSTPGVGSTFTIVLPRVECCDADVPPTTVHTDPSSGDASHDTDTDHRG